MGYALIASNILLIVKTILLIVSTILWENAPQELEQENMGLEENIHAWDFAMEMEMPIMLKIAPLM